MKLTLKALLLILFYTTLMNVHVSAMEEGQCLKERPTDDVLYVLPAEIFDMIILADLTNSGNIHKRLKRITTLCQVSKYFKEYCEQRYPDLLVVLHGIDSNDQDYDNRIAATRTSLYNREFSINARGHRARTIIHQAVKSNASNKVITTLLRLGAKSISFDSLRHSAYTLAQAMKNSGIIDLFDKVLSDTDKKILKRFTPYTATHVATQALVNENFGDFDDWLKNQTKEGITQQFDGLSIYNWLTRTIESTELFNKYTKHITALGLQPTVKLINIACQANNPPVLNCLLQQLQPKPTKVEIDNAFIVATQHGCPATISCLIEKGAKVNFINKRDATALVYAAHNGYTEIARLLVKNKANVNYTSKDGNTPLINAARAGYLKLCELLIDNGADVNGKNDEGYRALSLAVIHGHNEVVKLLVKSKANVNCVDELGNPVLTFAVLKGHLETCKLLIDNGAQVDAADNHGDTPLILAVKQGFVGACQLFIANGANVNHANNLGNTALLLAKTNTNDAILKLLIKNKANIDQPNAYGNTALLLGAMMSNSAGVIKLLVENGADVNFTNQHGHTPLMWAAESDNLDTCKLLVKHNANVDAVDKKKKSILARTAGKGHLEVVKFLVANGANVNLADNEGKTALDYAEQEGHDAVATYLKSLTATDAIK